MQKTEFVEEALPFVLFNSTTNSKYCLPYPHPEDSNISQSDIADQIHVIV